MTAPAFDLGAEVSAATAQQQAAIRLGRAQMAQEIMDRIMEHTLSSSAKCVCEIGELCEKEAAK